MLYFPARRRSLGGDALARGKIRLIIPNGRVVPVISG
jgi:hypothetical protein